MKRLMAAVAVAMAGMTAGCDRSGGTAPMGQLEQPALAAEVEADLRILGGNAGPYTWVFGTVRDVVLEVDGRTTPIEAGVDQDQVNLANTSHAWLLGKVTLPKGAQNIKLSFRFDDYGAYETATSNGAIHFWGAPISVDLNADMFVRTKHAVLLFNVDRTLAAHSKNPADRVALPNFMVRY